MDTVWDITPQAPEAMHCGHLKMKLVVISFYTQKSRQTDVYKPYWTCWITSDQPKCQGLKKKETVYVFLKYTT